MELLPPALDWSMTSFGGAIEWHDCASDDPSEWAYSDLEIFYGAGRCHHLAIANLRVAPAMRLGVLFETDADELSAPGLWIPHHVFAWSGLRARDVCGTRRLDDIEKQFGENIGLCRPEFVFYDEETFVDEVMRRDDAPLLPMGDFELARAERLLLSRGPRLTEEHRIHVSRGQLPRP